MAKEDDDAAATSAEVAESKRRKVSASFTMSVWQRLCMANRFIRYRYWVPNDSKADCKVSMAAGDILRVGPDAFRPSFS